MMLEANANVVARNLAWVKAEQILDGVNGRPIMVVAQLRLSYAQVNQKIAILIADMMVIGKTQALRHEFIKGDKS